eukprot:scaffold4055_cov132-Isochrysis_galbana.AAC.4
MADCGVARCAYGPCTPSHITASRAAAGWRDRRANQTSGPFPTMSAGHTRRWATPVQTGTAGCGVARCVYIGPGHSLML